MIASIKYWYRVIGLFSFSRSLVLSILKLNKMRDVYVGGGEGTRREERDIYGGRRDGERGTNEVTNRE